MFAPKAYRTYADKLHALFEQSPDLKRYVSKSVFPTASFEFSNGRQCRVHHCHPNGSVGWCTLFAGGEYDPSTGGHLYLPQVQLLIEFPPGTSILIPSTIVYGILPVASSQTRYTFSQYIPVDIIRYIDNGFRTRHTGLKADALKRDGGPPRDNRSSEELGLFSCLDSLDSDRRDANVVGEPNTASDVACSSVP